MIPDYFYSDYPLPKYLVEQDIGKIKEKCNYLRNFYIKMFKNKEIWEELVNEDQIKV